jgi:hypothetical protein
MGFTWAAASSGTWNREGPSLSVTDLRRSERRRSSSRVHRASLGPRGRIGHHLPDRGQAYAHRRCRSCGRPAAGDAGVVGPPLADRGQAADAHRRARRSRPCGGPAAWGRGCRPHLLDRGQAPTLTGGVWPTGCLGTSGRQPLPDRGQAAAPRRRHHIAPCPRRDAGTCRRVCGDGPSPAGSRPAYRHHRRPVATSRRRGVPCEPGDRHRPPASPASVVPSVGRTQGSPPAARTIARMPAFVWSSRATGQASRPNRLRARMASGFGPRRRGAKGGVQVAEVRGDERVHGFSGGGHG